MVRLTLQALLCLVAGLMIAQSPADAVRPPNELNVRCNGMPACYKAEQANSWCKDRPCPYGDKSFGGEQYRGMGSIEKEDSYLRMEPAKGDAMTVGMPPDLFKTVQNAIDNGMGGKPKTGLVVNNGSKAAADALINGDMAKAKNMPGANKEQAKSNQNAEKSQTADNLAAMERTQAATALDFIEEYSLKNFTVNGGNQWNQVRDRLFIPMAILLLLPGAVLAQVKSIASQGFAVLGEISPFEGIQRSIISIFLIPATYLVVNYGIDVCNSISYSIRTEYMNIFGTNMYDDAMCAHIRAFPIRYPEENFGTIPDMEAQMYPLINWTTPLARLEGKTLEVKLEDPCALLYIVPEDRAAETVPYYVNEQRVAYNQANAAFAMAWTLLCAFQIAYLYYLWFVGPVVAALWVYPMKQLRDALPSWIEGVVCLCFWSLFWNTAILLMACFRGVDETGTIMMTALNFLTISSVKFAFDFSGLVKDAGRQAASLAEKAAARAAQGGGKGGGGGGGGKSGGGAKSGGAKPGADSSNAAASHTGGADNAPAKPANNGGSDEVITGGSGTDTLVGSPGSDTLALPGTVVANGSHDLGHVGPVHASWFPHSWGGSNGFGNFGTGGNSFSTDFSSNFSSTSNVFGNPLSFQAGDSGGFINADGTINNAAFTVGGLALAGHGLNPGGGHGFNAAGLHGPGVHTGGHGFGGHGLGHGHGFSGIAGGHHGVHGLMASHHGGAHMGGHTLNTQQLGQLGLMAGNSIASSGFNAGSLPAINTALNTNFDSSSFNLSAIDQSTNLAALNASLANQPGIPMMADGTTVDFARMASDPAMELTALGISSDNIANIDNSTMALGGSIANADQLARDTQGQVQGALAQQQQAAVQAQIQQQQDQLNQQLAGQLTPQQQQQMQIAQQQQQQQVADLMRQQQADNTAWQQQQAIAASQPMNDQQRAQFNQQVQEQAQQRAQEQAQQMQQVMQQQRDQQAAILAQQVGGNPQQQAAQQAQLAEVQNQIAQTVQANIAQANQQAAQELTQQLARASADAGASFASTGFTGSTGAGITQVQGDLLSTSNMVGNSADGQFFKGADGLTWKNDATALGAPIPAPVTSADGLLRAADGGVSVNGLSVPSLTGGDPNVVAGMAASQGGALTSGGTTIDANYVQSAAAAATQAAYIAAQSGSGGTGGSLFDFSNTTNVAGGGVGAGGGGFTDHVVDGAGNLFTAQRDQNGNLFYQGQNGEKIVPQMNSDGTMTFYNPETRAVGSVGGSIEARINAENEVLARAASAEVKPGPAMMTDSLQSTVTGQPTQVNLEGQRTVNLDGTRPEMLSRDGGVQNAMAADIGASIGAQIGSSAVAGVNDVSGGITQVQGDLLSRESMPGRHGDTYVDNEGNRWKGSGALELSNQAGGITPPAGGHPPVADPNMAGQNLAQYNMDRGIQPTPENFMMGAAAAGAAHQFNHQDPSLRQPLPGQSYVDQPGISQQRNIQPGVADTYNTQKREVVNRLDKQVSANSPKTGAPGAGGATGAAAAAGAAAGVIPPGMRNAITKALGKAASPGQNGMPQAGGKPGQGSPKAGLGTPGGKGAANRVDNPMSDVTKGSTLRRYKKPKALSEQEKAELERAARESGNWLV